MSLVPSGQSQVGVVVQTVRAFLHRFRRLFPRPLAPPSALVRRIVAQRRTQHLARNSRLVIALAAMGCILVLIYGLRADVPVYRMSVEIWAGGFAVILLLYALAIRASLKLTADITIQKSERWHIILCLCLMGTLFSWHGVHLGLLQLSPPDGFRTTGMYSGRLFFLSQLCFFAIALIVSVSPLAVIITIPLSLTVPFTLFFQWPSPSTANSGREIFLYILYAQMAFFTVLGIVMSSWIRRAEISIAENQLSRDAADERAQFMNFLIDSAGHDLNSPLAAITMKIANLRAREPLCIDAADLEEIELPAAALKTIISGSFDLSLLRTGRMTLNKDDMTLPHLLRLIVASLRVEADAHKIDLDVEVEPLIVRTDPRWMSRIIQNLIVNAIKFTPMSGCSDRSRVLIRAFRVSTAVARIEVCDRGIGIPQEMHKKIFEPFVQLANEARNMRSGHGLGLAIVAQTAIRLGHDYGVESVPGEGSTFWVEMPCVDRIPHEMASTSTASAQYPSLGGMIVVVMDDHVELRSAMREMLEGWYCFVVVGASPEEVLSYLKCNQFDKASFSSADYMPPDLIICDFRINTKYNGLDAIKQLRDTLDARIPAVIWTGNISQELMFDLEKHDLEYLPKVFEIDDLYQILKRHFKEPDWIS